MEVRAKSARPTSRRCARRSAGYLGDQLQQFGGPADVLIRIAEQPACCCAAKNSPRRAGATVEYRREEVVGPRVSVSCSTPASSACSAAIAAILCYLWFRLEWQFALGAMIANVHDIVLTIGFMSITQIDFDLTSIAALLTILGYSLNDTVVIYDRIREMLRRYKKMPMTDLLNASINATLSRSDHHPRDGGDVVAALLLFGGRDPQFQSPPHVRRGAGRHLHVGVHRLADSDLSRRRQHAPARSG